MGGDLNRNDENQQVNNIPTTTQNGSNNQKKIPNKEITYLYVDEQFYLSMLEKIKRTFEKENIEIPFNQLDVHIKKEI